MDYSNNLGILYSTYLIYGYYLLALHSNEYQNREFGRFIVDLLLECLFST